MDKKIPRGFIEMTNETRGAIEEGAKVHLNYWYCEDRAKTLRYFVCELSDGFVLLADNKKMYNNGEGYIYSLWSIDSFKNPA